MKKKTNYQITIGYKAVICVNVQAEDELHAKSLGVEKFLRAKEKLFSSKDIELQDDNFNADGCLNMDATWNMYNS